MFHNLIVLHFHGMHDPFFQTTADRQLVDFRDISSFFFGASGTRGVF